MEDTPCILVRCISCAYLTWGLGLWGCSQMVGPLGTVAHVMTVSQPPPHPHTHIPTPLPVSHLPCSLSTPPPISRSASSARCPLHLSQGGAPLSLACRPTGYSPGAADHPATQVLPQAHRPAGRYLMSLGRSLGRSIGRWMTLWVEAEHGRGQCHCASTKSPGSPCASHIYGMVCSAGEWPGL